MRLEAGDSIRLPPFAWHMATQAHANHEESRLPLPPEIERYKGLIAYAKPAGLPTHPGTGHSDSLASRLAAAADGSFVPVPCHRLDKDTEGVLLVATSYASLRMVQDALANHTLIKEYVCWVSGAWPQSAPTHLTDYLVKAGQSGSEKMVLAHEGMGKKAETIVTPLWVSGEKSLLQVRIASGRTHQIRVQLAHAGHPVLFDHKYGVFPRTPHRLMLCAAKITLPDGHTIRFLPTWEEPYAVNAILQHSPDWHI